jgi:UDP-N-acetyl-D-glucosamine dehydrogenase
MPVWVVGKVGDALNTHRKPLNGARILMLGIAYKKNVDDLRESPAVRIMELLQEKGAVIAYSDPYIERFPRLREHYFDLASVTLTPEHLRSYDCAVLTTDHDRFDYALIEAHAQLIVDTRGVFQGRNAKIVRA